MDTLHSVGLRGGTWRPDFHETYPTLWEHFHRSPNHGRIALVRTSGSETRVTSKRARRPGPSLSIVCQLLRGSWC
jgi:hypothetical protein